MAVDMAQDVSTLEAEGVSVLGDQSGGDHCQGEVPFDQARVAAFGIDEVLQLVLVADQQHGTGVSHRRSAWVE